MHNRVASVNPHRQLLPQTHPLVFKLLKTGKAWWSTFHVKIFTLSSKRNLLHIFCNFVYIWRFPYVVVTLCQLPIKWCAWHDIQYTNAQTAALHHLPKEKQFTLYKKNAESIFTPRILFNLNILRLQKFEHFWSICRRILLLSMRTGTCNIWKWVPTKLRIKNDDGEIYFSNTC